MDDLKSYLSIIDPRLLNNVTGKPGELIQLFKSENFLSEEVFMLRLCAQGQSQKYYQDLKYRTIKQLQILAMFSNSKKVSLLEKKYENCQKKLLIGQKLLNNGKRNEGIRLIKKAYDDAVRFDFAYLACELSSILHHDHIYYNISPKKAAMYAAQVEKYLHNYTAEKKAEKYFFNVLGHTNRSTWPNRIQEAISKVEIYQGDSIKYQAYRHILKVLYNFHTSDYPDVIKNCNNALEFFKDRDGVYVSHYQFFYSKRGIAQMALSRFEDAEKSFQQATPYAQSRLFNKHLLQLNRTVNALHAGQYQLAYELYQNNKRCKIASLRTQFAIIEAYLCYLSSIGLLQIDKIFRIGRFLNETFKAQIDKRGDNVNILIAELLVHLGRNKGKFIDRVEAIKNYSYRHLKGKDTRRAKWFIKILCMIPRANFNPIALRRIASRQIEYLEKHPIRMGENFAVEIIPFDALLETILEQLQRKVA